jgi:hypothetical protein
MIILEHEQARAVIVNVIRSIRSVLSMPKGTRSIKVSWYMRTHIMTFFLEGIERASEVRLR